MDKNQERIPAANETRGRRKRKLVLPKVQLRLIGHFFVVASFALFLQLLLFARILSGIAERIPEPGPFLGEVRPALVQCVAISVTVLMPLVLLVGVSATFRIAGPVYRLREYLRSVVRGDAPSDCKLREGDHFHDLCELVNEATRPVRESGTADAAVEDKAAA